MNITGAECFKLGQSSILRAGLKDHVVWFFRDDLVHLLGENVLKFIKNNGIFVPESDFWRACLGVKNKKVERWVEFEIIPHLRSKEVQMAFESRVRVLECIQRDLLARQESLSVEAKAFSELKSVLFL